MQRALQLDDHQIGMARYVRQEALKQYRQLGEERRLLAAQIEEHDAQQVMQAGHASCAAQTSQLIGLVGQLADNALLQEEVTRDVTRQCFWRVCSPETTARCVFHSWPFFPNFPAILQAIAAAPKSCQL